MAVAVPVSPTASWISMAKVPSVATLTHLSFKEGSPPNWMIRPPGSGPLTVPANVQTLPVFMVAVKSVMTGAGGLNGGLAGHHTRPHEAVNKTRLGGVLNTRHRSDRSS